MNPHRRNLLGSLYLAAFILGAVGPHGAALAKDRKPPRIECDVSIPCPAEEAWTAWTTKEGLESFLARSARVTPEVGGAFALDLAGSSPVELDARSPRILGMDVPRSLSFEWIIPLPKAAARDSMTVVTIRIEQVSPQRCRVHLEHSGWAVGEEATEAFAYSQQSWRLVLRSLRSALIARGRGR